MPDNGSGVFNRIYNWAAQKAAGFYIDPVKVDAEDNGFATALSNRICRDGQSTIIANIPFNGFGITGLADPVNPQDAATKNYLSGLVSVTGIGGLIFGLTLSNDATTPNTVFDIASGAAATDDQTATLIAGAFTKTTAAWAAGTGLGALDTGSIASNTWYHVFVIGPAATDILLSHSLASPTMPTGYTKKRRIGSIKTDGSGHILAFTQNGDEFLWAAAPNDISTTTLGTSATLFSLSVPPGLLIDALLRGTATTSSSVVNLLVNSPSETTVTATYPNISVQTYSGDNIAFAATIRTDTSGRVRAVSNTAATTLSASTYGWLDTRGKNS